LGTFCFAWVFYRLLRTLSRRMPMDGPGTTILISLVIAYLVVCASDNMIDYLSFNWYFWFTIGVACSGISVLKKRKAVEIAGGAVRPAGMPPSRRRRLAQANQEQPVVTE
jgi:hypothetical protein